MEKITILHTNDLHSHFETFPRIKRYFESIREKANHDVFTFDAGDFLDRVHPLSDATEGKINVQLMNEMKYDLVTIGNNEGISNSHDVLNRLFTDAKFQTVCANLFEKTGELAHFAKPYTILTTTKGTKIGVIGLTPDYPMTYGPNGWLVKDYQVVLDPIIYDLRKNCDLLILLTHIGVRTDRMLAKKYPQIDVIVGGHSHDLLPEGEMVNGVLITQTGKWGRYVGQIDLELENGQVINKVSKTIPVKTLPVLPHDTVEIEGWKEKGKELLSQRKIANLPANLDIIEESLNAMCEYGQTDLAMISTGLFLKPFEKGILTAYDLQSALPHPMHIVRSKLLGRDLWRLVLEIEKNRRYLEHFPVQGMSFRGKEFGQMIYRGITVDPAKKEVKVHGQAIDFDHEYTISVLDHYVLVPFFPTLAIVGKNEFLFPDYLREVIGHYLQEKYPL